jgi:hypothetical protein
MARVLETGRRMDQIFVEPQPVEIVRQIVAVAQQFEFAIGLRQWRRVGRQRVCGAIARLLHLRKMQRDADDIGQCAPDIDALLHIRFAKCFDSGVEQQRQRGCVAGANLDARRRAARSERKRLAAP